MTWPDVSDDSAASLSGCVAMSSSFKLSTSHSSLSLSSSLDTSVVVVVGLRRPIQYTFFCWYYWLRQNEPLIELHFKSPASASFSFNFGLLNTIQFYNKNVKNWQSNIRYQAPNSRPLNHSPLPIIIRIRLPPWLWFSSLTCDVKLLWALNAGTCTY